MGHHYHVVVVEADTGAEALGEAEIMISDWGSENNWRTAVCAVSDTGKKHAADGHDVKDFDVNAYVDSLRSPPYTKEEFAEVLDKYMTKGKLSRQDWRVVEVFAAHASEMAWCKEKIDPFTGHGFNSGCYEEEGVTSHVGNHKVEKENLWAVFVDIHT